MRTSVDIRVFKMSRFQTNCFFRRSFLLGIPAAKESFVAETPVVPDADAMHTAPLAVLPLHSCSAVDAVGTLWADKAPRAPTLVDANTAAAVEARDRALACIGIVLVGTNSWWQVVQD